MKKILIIILAVLIIFAGTGAFLGYKITSSDKTLPGTYVGNTDVSKLTKDEVISALKASGYDTRCKTPLTVTLVNAVDFDVDPVEAGAMLSLEDAADYALSYGHDGNIFSNLLTYVKGMFKTTDINDCYRPIGKSEDLKAEAVPYSSVDNDYLSQQIMQGCDWMNEYFGIEEYYIDYYQQVLNIKKGHGQIDFDMDNLKAEIYCAIEEGKTSLNYDKVTKELTAPDFEAINNSLVKETTDAKYSDDGKFDVIDETDACDFDTDEALKMWNDAKIGENIAIPLTVTKAAVTGDELRERLFKDLLGAMSSRYTNSADNRCSNVRLCASKINEYILYPGEVFSYNTVVGKRTEEAGFLPAPAYVGLDSEETVKDEIGGGACQVSSTTYAATLFAFLETVDRTCHIYPVNYMQLGIDATVTIPDDGQEVDFKFKNNKNYPIKIVAYTEENETEKKLTVEIWGTLEDDDYMPLEFDASYSWTQDYDRFIEAAVDGREGYKIKLDHDVYTDVTDSGTLTSTQTWRRVYDTSGNLVEEEIVNLPNPATGQPSMDQYYQHP